MTTCNAEREYVATAIATAEILAELNGRAYAIEDHFGELRVVPASQAHGALEIIRPTRNQS